MKTQLSPCSGFLLGLLLLAGPVPPAFAGEPSAGQLIEGMLKARETQGFRGRVQAVSANAQPGAPARLTLNLKGRQDHEQTQLLYQALWPTGMRGQALVINFSTAGGISGFHFTPPDRVISLPRSLKAEPFFNTGLTVEEIVEDFWQWPDRKLAGTDNVLKHACRLVELRPPPKTASSYSLVRVCLSPELKLPLRIEKFRSDDRLAISITSDKVLMQGGKWASSVFSVLPTDGRPRTVFTFTGGDMDLAIPAEAFTPDKLKKVDVPQNLHP